MSNRVRLIIEAGMVIAALCMFMWWPWALDLFAWHTQPPFKGVCWFLSLLYLTVVCCAPIKVDGTRLSDIF